MKTLKGLLLMFAFTGLLVSCGGETATEETAAPEAAEETMEKPMEEAAPEATEEAAPEEAAPEATEATEEAAPAEGEGEHTHEEGDGHSH